MERVQGRVPITVGRWVSYCRRRVSVRSPEKDSVPGHPRGGCVESLRRGYETGETGVVGERERCPRVRSLSPQEKERKR